ncbi:hypothetical protein D0962_30500 [Leptolyngbyaceae cyanobacterium CCMR0082]|uniref:EcoEI R protein C-terminal domain-containing protein n=1 Tax=Adonisia turfae CCMR0082 TaxID=2304604 RepID=A0A6M0SHE1_9CYAN|nr:type I restriction-modification enzyme R subunit C-terminal domain-containing protein [Adonisia turfae]NEZ67032.1 hypothetical protein [Adonisia turfae CCMR0082]
MAVRLVYLNFIGITSEDFEDVPFNQKGGPLKAVQLFGQDLPSLLIELNQELAA